MFHVNVQSTHVFIKYCMYLKMCVLFGAFKIERGGEKGTQIVCECGVSLRPLIVDNKLLILFAIPISLSEFLCGYQILIAI